MGAGTCFAASPMISRLRTTARLRVSSAMNASRVIVPTAFEMNAASSRMWRRYSAPEGDILDLSKDPGPDVRAQRLRGDQLHAAPEQGLQEEGEAHEAVEGLPPRLELHQQVDVTVGTLVPPAKRAEQTEPPHAEAADTPFLVLQNGHDRVRLSDGH